MSAPLDNKEVIELMKNIHCIPGNIIVSRQLYDMGCVPDYTALEQRFHAKYPSYVRELGWLWIVYHKLCDDDIKRTAVFLSKL